MAKEPGKGMGLRGWLLIVGVLVIVAVVGAIFVAARSSGDASEHIAAGRQHMADGKLRAAIIEFKNAVKTDPDSGEARLALGEVALRVNDLRTAEKELRQARALGIEEPRVVLLLAETYVRLGQAEDVLTHVTPGDRGQNRSGSRPGPRSTRLPCPCARPPSRSQKRCVRRTSP